LREKSNQPRPSLLSSLKGDQKCAARLVRNALIFMGITYSRPRIFVPVRNASFSE
jgi:hypothetical protein